MNEEKQCQKQVPMRGMNFFRTRQCKNNAVKGKSFCNIHTPEAEEKRTAEQKADRIKKDNLNRAHYLNKLRRKK